jgi:hypothetical protein
LSGVDHLVVNCLLVVQVVRFNIDPERHDRYCDGPAESD